MAVSPLDDAYAKHVKITFKNFDNDYRVNQDSCIIIEDDGNGMDATVLKSACVVIEVEEE